MGIEVAQKMSSKAGVKICALTSLWQRLSLSKSSDTHFGVQSKSIALQDPITFRLVAATVTVSSVMLSIFILLRQFCIRLISSG
jgi:hypothetical protein